MRWWRVAGVLTLIGAEALLYGYTYPFFSLALEKRELANWLIGLNASLAGAGILFVGPVLPRLIATLGVRILVAALFAVSFLSFGAILVADYLVVWFVARFVMGTCFAAMWTVTEIWLNGVVDDRHRGRIIGASGTLYATCQFIGPLILGGVGVTGSLPLIVAMVPLAVGVLVALSIKPAEGEAEEDEGIGDPKSLKLALAVAGGLVAAAFLGGIGETAMQSLLPLYGIAHGLDDAGAARLVAVFSLGEAILVAGLGWMADRYGRLLTLRLCVIVATASCALMSLAAGYTVLLWPVLFFGGGTVAGIYTLGIVLIGQDFRGQTLAVVSTGFAMAYSAGSIIGSAPVGYLIDLFGPEALPVSIALGFAGLTAYLFMGRFEPRRKKPAEPHGVPNLTYLEDSLFDEEEAPATPAAATRSHVSFPPIAAAASPYRPPNGVAVRQNLPPEPELTIPLALQPVAPVDDDRRRHETVLEKVFRQRAAEIAAMIAERDRPVVGPAPRAAQTSNPFRPPARGGARYEYS